MSSDNNEIYTVNGPVKLDDLGITLTHEHISSVFEKCYEPNLFWMDEKRDESLKQEDISIYKRNPYCNKDNLTFAGNFMTDIMIYELSLFKKAGGKTIVENSSKGLLHDVHNLQTLNRINNINIIAGTGYYTAKVQNDSDINLTHEEMYDELLNDLTIGFKRLGSWVKLTNNFKLKLIKAGFIGEVGSSWPIHEFEKRSIRVTGEIQAQLHCAVNFNPGTEEKALEEVIRLYQEAGGDSKKAAISNIDRTLYYEDKFMEFMDDTTCYIQLDLFGTEHSFRMIDDKYYRILSDAQRIKRIAKLKEEGKLHRVLISHDIHTKDRLVTYGGHGYAHILDNVKPHMTRRNFETADLETLLTENPKKWLSWNQ